MEYKNIVFEKKSNIGIVTMNNPKKLNALTNETIYELDIVLDNIEKDKEIMVVIITGNGKAFVAGADIAYMKNLSVYEAISYSKNTTDVYTKITNSRKVFIGAINGFALGGGCEMALACDIRIAGDRAKFGLPEVGLGIIPGGGGTQRLPKLIGTAKAKELILTGDTIEALGAFTLGLVNKVVDQDMLMDTALEMARKIAKAAPVALEYSKECINKSEEMTLESGIEFEKKMFGLCFATEDQKEGMSAFEEKRAVNFKGK